MFGVLPIAVTGLYQSVARATQSASHVVNASSTGENFDEDLVNLQAEKTNVAANVAVIKTERKMESALLDILA